MRKVRVVSKKYNGTLRDEYETYLYAETDQTITLFSPPGLAYWDHRQQEWFAAPDGMIELYFKHKWYNVWHIAEQVSYTNLSYVNITMPTTFRMDTIEWVDLDLDYRVHLNQEIEKLDQAEFEQNVQRMGYPPELIEHVQLACREVEAGLVTRGYPFDYERQVELYQLLRNVN